MPATPDPSPIASGFSARFGLTTPVALAAGSGLALTSARAGALGLLSRFANTCI